MNSPTSRQVVGGWEGTASMTMGFLRNWLMVAPDSRCSLLVDRAGLRPGRLRRRLEVVPRSLVALGVILQGEVPEAHVAGLRLLPVDVIGGQPPNFSRPFQPRDHELLWLDVAVGNVPVPVLSDLLD